MQIRDMSAAELSKLARHEYDIHDGSEQGHAMAELQRRAATGKNLAQEAALLLSRLRPHMTLRSEAEWDQLEEMHNALARFGGVAELWERPVRS